MGVSGWNRLLAEEGWTIDAKSASCCSTSLWMEPNHRLAFASAAALADDDNDNGDEEEDPESSSAKNTRRQWLLSDRIVEIPPSSELHIDGYCLCFHLFDVAYARHRNSVLHSKSNHHQRPCARPNILQSLTPQQVRHLNPSFLPLKLLADVTTEFVRTLTNNNNTKNGMQLIVYWDGDRRVVHKHATDTKRQSRLDDEWNDYHLYCQSGRMPTVNKICQWATKLPKHRLFCAQVLHSLQASRAVTMVHCDEEADRILAMAVRNKPNAYIVGLDSDFCFFPDANYIPLPTLHAAKGGGGATLPLVTACVIRRDALAESLGLPDESAMLELAILLGNDYVDPDTAQFVDRPPPHPRRVGAAPKIDFLRERGEGFRVTSESDEVTEAMRFVRMLYSLESLEEEELFAVSDDDDDDSSLEESSLDDDNEENTMSMRPMYDDEDVDTSLLVIQPGKDRFFKDVVRRCLQAYVDQGLQDADARRPIELTQEHIATFEQLTINNNQSYKEIDNAMGDKDWRPEWLDVKVVYLIEKLIGKCIWDQYTSPIVSLYPPYFFFDQYKYHALLISHRGNKTKNVAPSFPLKIGPVDSPKAEEVRLVLPVDEFEDTILASVRNNKVTIIHGETGCGKSTRIPIMLLRAPPPKGSPSGLPKLFISQPRRIAAKALVERLRAIEPDLRDQISLRMGHGVREYETPSTRAFFVTTGYLVRLLANHPQRFDDVTYLIIDEVHERSVDTDLLCLLCRRLLTTNPRIRLVLMSATLAAAMFQEYFQCTEPVIKVGGRRFPVEEVYLNDLSKKVTLPGKESKIVDALLKECIDMKCRRTPAMSYMEKLFTVVANLATVVGKPGSSVLIFVSGLSDIVAIIDLVEQCYVAGVSFTTFPIHGDIPFEDQMDAFIPPRIDEVKIIIATNSAESSITLPDVDHVICLGLCKQIIYNETSHRQMLVPTWISRASATQRAGRTGRVRPGTVYRMYSRENHNSHMESFEPGEILRIPLDSVILMLKQILPDEEVTKVLSSCLEPPNTSTIERSFDSLFRQHFITTPEDSTCQITHLGNFVSELGIDLSLGSLIGLGIQFGVGAEAIQMASILSFPKSPWIQSNPLIHDSASYNKNVSATFTSKCHFDANLYSEPMSVMNLLWDYNHIDASSKQRWCNFYNIFLPRLKRLDSTHLNLMLRVAKFLGISPELLKISIPPTQMTPEKVIILRIVQFWVFNDTIIQFDPSKVTLKKSPKGFYLDVLHNSDPMDTNMLESVLRRDSQPFEVVGQKETIQKGNFQFKVNGDRIDQNGERADQAFSVGFEDRLLSYSSEKALSLAWVKYNDKVLVYYREQLKNTPDFVDVVAIPLDQLSNDMSFLVARAPSGKNRRGRAERPCGLWTISQPRPGSEENMSGKTWIKICCVKTKSSTKKLETLELKLIKLTKENSIASISIQFGCLAHPIDDKPVQFTIFARGPEPGVSNTDLKDMMAAPVTSSRSSSCRQKLLFPVAPTSRMVFSERDNPSAKVESTSWSRPLIDCIPEAIRVLSVLASGRRKDHRIRFPKEGTNEAKEPEVFNDLYLDPDVTKISHRWTRFNASAKVFVDTSSVPASAIPMEGEKILYCTCANALEVNGGGMRVEGLTLLPPGREFLLLCRLTFGIDERKHLDDGSIFQKSIEFVKAKGKDASTLREKVRQAIQFDDLAKKSGEKLECFPDNVALLLSVFEGIDKCSSTTWKGLETNPLIAHNLRTNQMAYKVSRPSLNSEQWKNDSELDVSRDDVGSIGNRMVRDSGDTPPNSLETAVASRNNAKRSTPIIHHTLIGNGLQILTQFTEEDVTVTKNLFLQTLPPGQKVDERDIPSSNILSLVVSQVSTDVDMSVAGSDWKFYTTSIAGKSWYFAFFSTNGLAFVERKSKGMPSWLKSTSATNARPDTIEGARRCIPSGKIVLKSKAKVFTYDKRNVLVFDSLELAIRMESAFWLERQFCSWKFHWYENMDIEKMVNRLQRLCLVTNS